MTSESAPTPQDQFRPHLARVLSDLRHKVEEDGEVVALIGSLASELSGSLDKARWSDAKDVMSSANYNELLQSFQTQGNALHQAGENKKAYAIQALSTSLVAATLRADTAIAEGEGLLDALIDRAIVLFKRHTN
jgi:hypothetical protein